MYHVIIYLLNNSFLLHTIGFIIKPRRVKVSVCLEEPPVTLTCDAL